MRFNPKARLDTSRMRDRGRGGGGGGGGMGGGGMRVPIPGGTKAGGGIGGLLIIVLFVVLTQCMGDGAGGGPSLPDDSLNTSRMAGADSGRYEACRTGADANNSADCARVAVENSLVAYWSKALPDQAGVTFHPEAELDTFSGQTQTGCGAASSAVGPFYCPVDETIYLDTTFFQDVLQNQLGGPAGAFVEPYVIAHEFGHHIQNLMGTMGQVKTQKGPQSDSVRLELQADCYAGMWTKNATSTDDSTGQQLIQDLSDQDIQEAIAAAKSVGDDRIQQETSGQVNPEQWTHGSAQARVKWFMTGYQQGSLDACDTFSPTTVE